MPVPIKPTVSVNVKQHSTTSIPHPPFSPSLISLMVSVDVKHHVYLSESRRDQEEGGELDSHEEASPEETKSREVALGWREAELDFFCFSRFPTAELRTLSL